jgi:4'-phosphopantetheinyl transferase
MIKDDNTLHVWKIPLDLPESELAPLFSLLDETEKQRAKQFHFDIHRRRYIAAHAAMRLILAEQLKISAQTVDIQVHQNGKPFLPNSSLHFNLSHSEELALIALSNQAQVGVDVEHIKDDVDVLGISRRFFHPLEAEQLEQMPPALRERSFYHCWTGKEAYLKANGLGIGHHLKMFALDLQSPQKLQILCVEKGFDEFSHWFGDTFSLGGQYIAAIVAKTAPNSVIFHDYNESF